MNLESLCLCSLCVLWRPSRGSIPPPTTVNNGQLHCSNAADSHLRCFTSVPLFGTSPGRAGGSPAPCRPGGGWTSAAPPGASARPWPCGGCPSASGGSRSGSPARRVCGPAPPTSPQLSISHCSAHPKGLLEVQKHKKCGSLLNRLQGGRHIWCCRIFDRFCALLLLLD